MIAAYYNEIDAFAAQWLRNLIAAGHIAPGEVDTRSIAEVQPDDVQGFTQVHFFAGIGGWSLALRLAGWPDDRPIWTGSCPCQPFSAAGKQRGTEDERHLWPVFANLIGECRPTVVAGEQVASALGRQWLGTVRADLEALGYAVGAADLGAASVGAPHFRQRLWWVGQSTSSRRERGGHQSTHGVSVPGREGVSGVALGDASREGLPAREREAFERAGRREERRTAQQPGCASGGLADDDQGGCERQPAARLHERWPGARGDQPSARDTDGAYSNDANRRSAIGGFWSESDWLPCRDGKNRPVEPGTFPLAHGIPGRVGRLRAYGNAIVPQVAAEFIGAFMECAP